MNDPWDVKSVRLSGHYISCMKLNGVPLLPPVLSKECRKEMQYYKLLAKEVEKRISLLQPYVFDSYSSCSEAEDQTEAPELPECEQNYELSQEEPHLEFDVDKIGSISPPHPKQNETFVKNFGSPTSSSAKYIVDVNRNINETTSYPHNPSPILHSPPASDLPERDYNCVKRVTQKAITEKKVITAVETKRNFKKKTRNYRDDYIFNIHSEPLSDPFSGIPLPQDGPSSLSSKSFTGSLNDLHSESIKDSIGSGKLIRQRSYTLLKPSPQLLAHLEVHSQNTGIEMTSISMSESLSNITSPSKKRRSWDLESAKVKWSTMALELNQKNVTNVTSKTDVSKTIVKPNPKSVYQQRAKSVTPNQTKRNNVNSKLLSKSEPLPNTKKSFSPVVNKNNDRALKTEPPTPRVIEKNGTSTKLISIPISESEDPAARVRELYEKIQKQQLVQMANLVEKQKKEQILLQQVFEEQNNLLFKQLKTICPKSPIEAKEAWGDQLLCEGDRGPVSLSQVINYKSPEQSSFSSPVSSTLNDTNHYINHCDSVLKKSRDITASLKKPQTKSYSQNGTKIQSPRTHPEGSRTRTHSPVRKATTSRKLNYDSSASTDRDYDQILTDRTNDTLADLNVTFPSDHTDEGNSSVILNKSVANYLSGKEVKTIHGHSGQTNLSAQSRSIEQNNNIERPINSSINNVSARSAKTPVFRNPPTAKERAAATKIVAHVKGYLVRRLMRTDRVQGIVQTIKDALLCALQLHQDREGIRGADVDLHRRLIQQITAACYSLHDTFVASTPAERCAMIAADRGKRRRSLASRTSNNSFRQTDIMSQSHTGSFPARAKSRQPPSLMTQSNYETFSGDKSSPVSRRYMASPRRRPWR